jgi:hypothetical protein
VLRFGVMCNDTSLRAWERTCLERLVAMDGVKLSLVVLDATPAPTTPPVSARVRGAFSRGFLHHVYRRYIFRPEAMAPADARDLFAGIPELRCAVTTVGHSQYFAPADVAAIREARLDFLLRFGFNIIRGDILDSARFGVWSFHHGDEQRYRGQPACFWEIYRGDPVTGSMLQRLTERLDGGVVLRKAFFKTRSDSYVANREQALVESAEWPAQVCRDIQRGCAAYVDGPPSTTTAPLYSTPTNLEMIRFGLRVKGNRALISLRHALWQDAWNVGVVRRPLGDLVRAPHIDDAIWAREDEAASFADPFAAHREGVLHVVCERLDKNSGMGSIVTAPLEHDDAAIELGGAGPALSLAGHASYPFLLEHDGRVYCVPETHFAHEVALYRADRFPTIWTKVTTLVEGIAAVDPTLFHHEDRWWLFLTDRDRNSTLHLFLYFAPELAGPWEGHPGNPVKSDVRSSRPAGTPFVHEGVLYRPAQDCARTYGGRIVLNRVNTLTTTEFEEETALTIEPAHGSAYRDGTHTLSAAGDLTLVDGMRRRLRSPTLRRLARQR